MRIYTRSNWSRWMPVTCTSDARSRCDNSWWRHQMESFSALLAICAGNSPVPGEFPAQRPVTRSFEVFFDLRLNKRLSKQSWGWWFQTLSRPLWRHCNVCFKWPGGGNPSPADCKIHPFFANHGQGNFVAHRHYSDVLWAWLCLKSPDSMLFVQRFKLTSNMMYSYTLLVLCEENPPVVPSQKDQQCWKDFNAITSSWVVHLEAMLRLVTIWAFRPSLITAAHFQFGVWVNKTAYIRNFVSLKAVIFVLNSAQTLSR